MIRMYILSLCCAIQFQFLFGPDHSYAFSFATLMNSQFKHIICLDFLFNMRKKNSKYCHSYANRTKAYANLVE